MALSIATVDETVVAGARPIAMPLPDPGTCWMTAARDLDRWNFKFKCLIFYFFQPPPPPPPIFLYTISYHDNFFGTCSDWPILKEG